MWKEPIKAIINLDFYRKIAKKSIWRAFLYSAYLFALYMVIISIAATLVFKPKINNFINKHAENTPRIVFNDGILNINDDKPIAVVINKNNDVRLEEDWKQIILEHDEGFILANTGKTEPVNINEMKENNIAAYITKDTFYVLKNNNNSMQVSEMPDIDFDFEITSEILLNNIDSITKGILSFMLTIMAMFTILKMIFFTICIFLLGLIINSFRRMSVTTGEMFKWSIYLVTPILLIGLISTLFQFKIPFAFVIYLVMAGFYLDKILKREDK